MVRRDAESGAELGWEDEVDVSGEDAGPGDFDGGGDQGRQLILVVPRGFWSHPGGHGDHAFSGFDEDGLRCAGLVEGAGDVRVVQRGRDVLFGCGSASVIG